MTHTALNATDLAHVGWNYVTEPEDAWAHAVINAWDAAESWEWLRTSARRGDSPEQQTAYLLAMMPGKVSKRLQAGLTQALTRWSARAVDYDQGADLEAAAASHTTVITPESPLWPTSLDATEEFIPPLCLWVRGDVHTLQSPAVSIVGSRAATAYGEYVTSSIVDGLGGHGLTIISGGAYGIDAAAHRAALANDLPTVAVVAGGVDRLYPAGNTRLFESLLDSGGSIVSEMPPGSAPRRMRFLQRNRIIAALGQATVVTEAAWRSGALSTAQRAATLCRPVGAVPGPVTSAASAGCHRLMRDGVAVCVTTAAEVLELLPDSEAGTQPREGEVTAWRPTDTLDLAVWDAMPLRTSTTLASLSRIAGQSESAVLAALTRMELAGEVTQNAGKWRRKTQRPEVAR